MSTRSKVINLIIIVFLIIGAVLFVFPVLLVYMNSFKPLGEILANTIKLPENITFENFIYVFKSMNFPRLFLNTVIITTSSIILIIIVSSMAGYMLSRNKSRISNILIMIFFSSMIIPFQSIMIPLVKVSKWFHLTNSMVGIIILIVPLFSPFAVFLYHGFVKMLPRELDEAAKIDGCSTFGIFFRIILPLLKPVTSSVIIIETLWIWNDFALPVIMLQSSEKKTITIGIYSFFSSMSMRWDYALAGLMLSSIPVVIFYIIMQKNIIKGVASGAIKG